MKNAEMKGKMGKKKEMTDKQCHFFFFGQIRIDRV